jgi:hypothetical protein
MGMHPAAAAAAGGVALVGRKRKSEPVPEPPPAVAADMKQGLGMPINRLWAIKKVGEGCVYRVL